MSLSFVSSMYLYLAEGSVIFVTNGVLLICIVGKKKNRERREFLLIGVQAMADTCYAVAFMLIAQLRLNLAATGRVKSTSKVWECAMTPALPLHNWATPSWVSSLSQPPSTSSPAQCSLFVPHLMSLLLSILNTIFTWGDKTSTPAMCVAAKGAAHHVIYGVMLGLRIAANLASALLYAAILIYLRHVQKSSLQEMTPQQHKTHRNATITLGCVTVNSVLLLFIPDILLFFNPGNISQDYSTLLYSMTLSKTTINFFIYMWRYKELRDMVVTMTCRRLPQLRKYFPDIKSRTSIAPVMSAQWETSRIGTVSRITQGKRSSVAAFDRRPSIEQMQRMRQEVKPQGDDLTLRKDEASKKDGNQEASHQHISSRMEINSESVDITRFWFNI